MGQLTKYIYFPTGQETGMVRHVPVVVYAFDEFSDGNRFYIKASTNPENADRHCGKFLIKNRAVRYTDALWDECKRINRLRVNLEQEYEKLWKNRRKFK